MSILDTIKALFCNTSTERNSAAPVTATVISEAVGAAPDARMQIPEDSTLKRHFMSNLKCDIEAKMQPCPTESTLKRHYDSTVQAELEKRLG